MQQEMDMPPVFESIYREMMDQVAAIKKNEDDVLKCASKRVAAAIEAMEKLKAHVFENPFQTTTDEVLFFKSIKPQFYSRFIHYLEIYRIELDKPPGGKENLEKYFSEELCKLQQHFSRNREFYHYYRSGATHLDAEYFLSSKERPPVLPNPHYFDLSERFSSRHDYTVSRILANEMLGDYLNGELIELAGTNTSSFLHSSNNSPMVWTAPKAGLIEFIYACQSYGVFNNGQADIRQISDHLQRMFNVNLGNLYRTFQELRIRKKGRSYFLDQLREKLIERMDHADENPR